jgi:hypothetical protein
VIVVEIGDGKCASKGEKNVHGQREDRRALRIPSTPWRHPIKHVKNLLPFVGRPRGFGILGRRDRRRVRRNVCSIACSSLDYRVASSGNLIYHFPTESPAPCVCKHTIDDALRAKPSSFKPPRPANLLVDPNGESPFVSNGILSFIFS